MDTERERWRERDREKYGGRDMERESVCVGVLEGTREKVERIA